MRKLNLILILILSVSIFTCGGSSSNDGDTPEIPELPDGVTYTVDGKSQELLLTLGDTTEIDNYTTCLSTCIANPPTEGSTIDEYMDYLECIMGCFDYFGDMPQGAFSIRIVFTNSNSIDVTVVIPAGSLFNPASSETQPMMTIQDLTFIVPAGGTLTELIPTFCLAAQKHAPDEDDTYTYAGSVSKDCLLTILGILENKDIDNFDYSDIMEVQYAAWNCMEGTFSQTDIDNLDALP